jgi:hypothetical protein
MHASDIRTSAVVNDFEARLGRQDLFEWIEEQADRLGSLGRVHGGPLQFTRELRRACKVHSVDAGAVTSRAELHSDGGGFLVKFNAKYSPAARRFAIAHEFGHTLLTTPAIGTEPSIGSSIGRGDRAVEAICDYFAAALLLPRNTLRPILERDPQSRSRPPAHLLPEIARRFHVQCRIAAWRVLLVTALRDWILLRAQAASESNPLLRVGDVTAWKSIWYVSGDLKRKPDTVKGFEVPFATRRRIPTEMIPTAGTQTEAVCLDTRWWDGARMQPADDARRPMRIRPADTPKPGYAARFDHSVYIALRNE